REGLIGEAVELGGLDEHHRRYRASEARGRSRSLRGRDVVTVRWATDARCLAIEVRDRWGTLEPRSVASRLATGRGKTTGAPGDTGMGLALAYACCNQFVIDLEPEVMTEVIALLDVRHRPAELARSAAFHTFLAEAPRESGPPPDRPARGLARAASTVPGYFHRRSAAVGCAGESRHPGSVRYVRAPPHLARPGRDRSDARRARLPEPRRA